MTISSRTPEGVPKHCPVCHADIRVDPSPLIQDATCASCGSLLWLVQAKSETYVFYSRKNEHAIRVVRLAAEELDISPEQIANYVSAFQTNSEMDSLDLIELVLELEEDFGRPTK